MLIEKWNSKTRRFEKREATETDIEELFYVLEYTKAEANIVETQQLILDGEPDIFEYTAKINKKKP
tara:strand:+ start:47 stop:244 length:198 start_codon:yes stop_codon:yes gene_type:complete